MDGSFRYSLDLFSKSNLQSNAPQLRITYNSRSLHQGVFGLGWCASFEKKLLYRQGSYWLLDCDRPQPQKLSSQQALKFKNTNPDKIKLLKTPTGYQIENGKEKIQISLKKSLLESIQSPKINFSFQYDKNLNLTILKNQSTKKFEMVLYDDQDRVQSHQHINGCFDEIQYEKDLSLQYTTVVDRTCPATAFKPEKKEKILYVFSIKQNKKQQRTVSSIQIRRDSPTNKPSGKLSQLP